MIDVLDHRLLNEYQRDFPLTPRPYAQVAADLDVSEDEVLERLQRLRDAGAISRVGAVVRPNSVGASTLAAMAVPAARLTEVAAYVSGLAAVNHNYEREHVLNLWFVVTASDQKTLAATLAEIAAETGLEVCDLRLEADYHIDLGFPL